MTLSPDEIARLNALPKLPSARGILEPTFIRHINAVSGAWLMSSKGAWPMTTIRDSAITIEEILSRWNVVITGTGQDGASDYLDVGPCPSGAAAPVQLIRSRAALVAKLDAIYEKAIAMSETSSDRDYERGYAAGLARAMREIRDLQENP